jgi:hypothetical protein
MFPEIASSGVIRPRRWNAQGSGVSSTSLI